MTDHICFDLFHKRVIKIKKMQFLKDGVKLIVKIVFT